MHRDYSHRSLLDKLGVSEGQRVAALNVSNVDFLRLLAETSVLRRPYRCAESTTRFSCKSILRPTSPA